MRLPFATFSNSGGAAPPERCPRCAWAAGELQTVQEMLAHAEARVAEVETAIRACRWGVVDGFDVNSAVVLPRDDWERLQAAAKGEGVK